MVNSTKPGPATHHGKCRHWHSPHSSAVPQKPVTPAKTPGPLSAGLLKKLFPNAADAVLQQVANELNADPKKFGLDKSTPSRGARNFLGTVEPAAPRAEIRQIWFERGNFSHLMHVCQGGDGPCSSGVAVLHGERVLSNAKCQSGPDAVDYFARELVEFGDSNDHGKSHTPLLQLGDYGNPIDKLYPMPEAVFH